MRIMRSELRRIIREEVSRALREGLDDKWQIEATGEDGKPVTLTLTLRELLEWTNANVDEEDVPPETLGKPLDWSGVSAEERAREMEKVGTVDLQHPILVLVRPNGSQSILDGNHRLHRAKMLGVETVPVKRFSLTDLPPAWQKILE